MPDHYIDENEVLRDALSGLTDEVPPMPEDLHAAWMQKVEEDMEEKRTSRTRNQRGFTRFLSMAAALLFIVGGTFLTRDSLGSDSLSNASVADEPQVAYAVADTDAAAGIPETGYVYTTMASAGSSNGVVVSGTRSRSAEVPEAPEAAVTEKKIIRTASLTIRTQSYETSLSNLLTLCEGVGGWTESSSESTSTRTGLRTIHLTLRIPQSSLDGFLVGTADCGRITSRSETATDVTASYQDTQTRLDTQLALMERLQALIPESASLADLLALESQIADTQYMIDTLTTQLAATDRQVAYSTVTISLYEETAPAITDGTVSLGQRLLSALRTGLDALLDFLQDMIVFLVAALPFIGIVAVFALAFFIAHRIRRNRK